MKKKIILKIREILQNTLGEISYALRMICGKPTPLKRLAAVTVTGLILGIASAYTLVCSVYHIGKNDGRRELPEMEHIRELKLKNDSIKSIKNYELKIKR
jgi:hypothetical protein